MARQRHCVLLCFVRFSEANFGLNFTLPQSSCIMYIAAHQKCFSTGPQTVKSRRGKPCFFLGQAAHEKFTNIDFFSLFQKKKNTLSLQIHLSDAVIVLDFMTYSRPSVLVRHHLRAPKKNCWNLFSLRTHQIPLPKKKWTKIQAAAASSWLISVHHSLSLHCSAFSRSFCAISKKLRPIFFLGFVFWLFWIIDNALTEMYSLSGFPH